MRPRRAVRRSRQLYKRRHLVAKLYKKGFAFSITKRTSNASNREERPLIHGRAEVCRRLYAAEVGDDLEGSIVDALFDVYPAAKSKSNELFLPDEALYAGGGHVRRGMLEKKIAEGVERVGGSVEPQITYRRTAARLRVGTSHYSLYRVGKIVFTISSVGREHGQPRFAQFRTDYKAGLIPKAAIPFEIFEEAETVQTSPDAEAWFVLKHGKEPYDSSVPQFAHMAAIDQSGEIVWHQNLFESQLERVESWVGKREIEIKDDPALVTLKAYIRRLRLKSA